MSRRRSRRATASAVIGAALVAACASGTGGHRYTSLIMTGDEIRDAGHATAYDALSNHREIIIFQGRITFQGGDDRSGLGVDRLRYTEPLLVVDGDADLNDAVTVLRGILAEDIDYIQLYYASMIPPRYRRPDAVGGLIEVRTRS